MLQFIREKTAGVVVKILFLFLVLSFAVWGIGDYRFLQKGETPAVTVSGEAVPNETIRLEFQRDLDRLRRSIGEIDRDMLRQFGVATQTAERIANQRALDRVAADLALVVSDSVVRRRIQEDPNFQTNGAFDAMSFRRLLQENGFNEARYVDLMRGDAARATLIEAVTLGVTAPTAIADRLFRHREERRRGTALFITAASMPDPGEPEMAALRAVYEANAIRFTDPEWRGGAVVRIGIEEVRDAIAIDDDVLRGEFERRRRDFATPERRSVELIRFEDAAAASTAVERIAAGTDFLAVAVEAGQSIEQVQAFGTVTLRDLPAELAGPVFALARDAPSAPIATPLGVFVARVTAIEAGSEPDFASLRAQLAEEQVLREAAEIAYRTATRVEEALNEGRPLAEAAAAAGVPVRAIEAMDASGRDRSGAPVPSLAGAPEALRAFAEAAPGRDSPLIESRNGAYFFLRVDNVTPSQLRAFDAVRDEVAVLWRAEQRDNAARSLAESLAKESGAARSLAELGTPHGLQPQPLPAMRRDGRSDSPQQRPPAALAARLFQLAPGNVGVASLGDAYAVVQLDAILPADPGAATAAVKQLSDGLGESIAGDLGRQYVDALRARLNVVIDPSAVDKLYSN